MRIWQEVKDRSMNDRTMKVQLDRFSAIVDPLDPSGGLLSVLLDGQEQQEIHLLAPQLPTIAPSANTAGVEDYVRAGDFIGTYHDCPSPQLRTQIYWRVTAHARQEALAALEIVASVQTALLDSSPHFAVRTQLLAGEAFRLVDAQQGRFVSIVPPSAEADPDSEPNAPHCYLFRLPGRQYSYAEMIYPADDQQTTWDGWLHGTEFSLQLKHDLFANRLEKGVILRARILGVVLDRRGDKDAAARHYAAFVSDHLPLTT